MNKMKSSTKTYKPLKHTHIYSQAEILKLKNTMTDLKNPVETYYSRFDLEEERISELKDRSFKIMQSEEQKENE